MFHFTWIISFFVFLMAVNQSLSRPEKEEEQLVQELKVLHEKIDVMDREGDSKNLEEYNAVVKRHDEVHRLLDLITLNKAAKQELSQIEKEEEQLEQELKVLRGKIDVMDRQGDSKNLEEYNAVMKAHDEVRKKLRQNGFVKATKLELIQIEKEEGQLEQELKVLRGKIDVMNGQGDLKNLEEYNAAVKAHDEVHEKLNKIAIARAAKLEPGNAEMTKE